MNILKKIKSKLSYVQYEPLVMNDALRDAYQTCSVVGGTLKGRIALVTGATSGIGFAIAERLLNEGCTVVITGRNAEKLNKASGELLRRSSCKDERRIATVLMDQYKPHDITADIEKVFSVYDINIVVNNAGFFGKKDQARAFRSVTADDYFQAVDVNLKSTILISEIAARHMAGKGRGNILNISSICGRSRNHYYTPYGISKTGVIRFTRDLHERYKDKGVVINTVEPGSVATMMNNSKANDNIAGTRPLHHVILPEQIAALVAFMVSPVARYLSDWEMKACATENV